MCPYLMPFFGIILLKWFIVAVNDDDDADLARCVCACMCVCVCARFTIIDRRDSNRKHEEDENNGGIFGRCTCPFISTIAFYSNYYFDHESRLI